MGKKTGFTLIELLIALAIMAIVSAIAVPLYTSYSHRTFRNEAQADLLNCAQGLERFFPQSGRGRNSRHFRGTSLFAS